MFLKEASVGSGVLAPVADEYTLMRKTRWHVSHLPEIEPDCAVIDQFTAWVQPTREPPELGICEPLPGQGELWCVFLPCPVAIRHMNTEHHEVGGREVVATLQETSAG